MTPRRPLPIELTAGPFRTREVDDLAVPRKRLRASDVHRPFHGVRATRLPVALVDRAEALAIVLRPMEAFSHVTAAALLGAPLPRTRDSRLHVTATGGADRMQRPGIVGHRAGALSRSFHLGLPIVSPTDVFVQVASMLSHDDLVAVGDYLVTPNRREHTPALASIDDLRSAIPERARGVARARRALADVRVGPESRMESLLRLLLIRSGLPEPVINPAIRVGDRELHPDLAYPQWSVLLEYEGDGHRVDAQQWRRDIWRREEFESAGWRVIRVHRDDVLAEREAFLARVCHILAQRRGAQPSGTLDQHPRDGGRPI